MSRAEYDRISEAYAAARFGPDATVGQMREAFAAGAAPAPAGVACERVELGGRPALQLTAAARDGHPAGGALLYLHGGGFVIGSAETGAGVAGALAARTGATAYSLDYRLAPEDPFPAAVDDTLAAYRDLLDRAPADRIVVAGDSAGGGLAIAMLLAARDAGMPVPAGVAVFSPWVDLTLSGPSIESRDGDDPLFTPADLTWYAERYLPGPDRDVRARAPLASPALADLTGLPPMLVQVGGRELLLDDAVRLAARAAHDGVDIVLEVEAGAPHNVQTSVGSSPAAEVLLDRAGAFLATTLGDLTRAEVQAFVR